MVRAAVWGTQVALENLFQGQGIADRKLGKACPCIRKKCNATDYGFKGTRSDALSALVVAFTLGVWFLRAS